MGACIDAVLECGAVVLVGLGIGLAANAAGDDGLDLGRNHFPRLQARTPSTASTEVDTQRSAGPAARAEAADDAPSEIDPPPPGDGDGDGGSGSPGQAAQADEAFAPAHVLARLEEHGLQAMLFEEARATFDDPLHAYGAYVFVDARQEEPYDEGHIPGAYLFDRYRPERYLPEITALITTSQRIVVYCNGGECEDSEYAADFLMQFGASRESLFVFVGGIAEWKARGMPTERGARDSGVFEGQADG